MTPIKTRYQIPSRFQLCHTTIVDGYGIEAHVPVRETNRLLEECPDIMGWQYKECRSDGPARKVQPQSHKRV